jgi:ATP-dependent Clp protease ATP-binding subunit ClpA
LFSKFSTASLRVLRAAEQECRNHNHYYVGAEHLTVALLEEPDPEIVRELEAGGVDPAEAHASVRRSLGTGDERLWEGILVTPRVRAIVQLAERQAGSREIEPLDLLRAVRAEGGSLAAEILRRSASKQRGGGRVR